MGNSLKTGKIFDDYANFRTFAAMKQLLLSVVVACFAIPVQAQYDDDTATTGLKYKVEMQASLSNGDHEPLWLNANKYGLSSLSKSNGYLRASIERPLSNDLYKRFGYSYSVDLAAATGFTSRFVVQQAYLEGRWLKGLLTVGSKEQPIELKNQKLSTGAQTLGKNARPVPQVRLSLPEYWEVPLTRGWLSLKGHIAYGMTTDDKWQRDFTQQQTKYTSGALYHSKAGYLKIGNDYRMMPVSLELGLEMACQFGGKAYNARDQIVENEGGLKGMVRALIPSGGESVETQYRNTSGNHLGSWMFRLNFDYDTWYFGLYGDHFFEDQSSMLQTGWSGYGSGEEWNKRTSTRIMVYSFKDMLLGADLRLKQMGYWVNNILVEFLYSKYQSGPVYHDHTQKLSDQVTGVDNYYNHYIFTGWQHWGQAIGNPLFTSPLYNSDGTIKFQNNRFSAWHFALAGDPSEFFHYRLMATLQHSFGTYLTPFANPVNTQSLLAEADYHFPEYTALNTWSIKAAVGADFGSVYGKNVGAQLTISKSDILHLNKRKR